jgi:putative restriction endonuclease
MSEGRNIEQDRESTRAVIAGTRFRESGKKNWLGHGLDDDTTVLDGLFLEGATKEQLKRKIRTPEPKKWKRIERHGDHLRVFHGLKVVSTGGVYRIDREDLGVEMAGGGSRLGVESITPPGQAPAPEPLMPGRRAIEVNRIIRDTAVSRSVKEAHDCHCQVCGIRLETPSGFYAEGAHVRPLGSPHDGPDVADNILCLCPNHHVLFDGGAFSVRDDLSLIGLEGRLRTVGGHPMSPAYLAHHRGRFGF